MVEGNQEVTLEQRIQKFSVYRVCLVTVCICLTNCVSCECIQLIALQIILHLLKSPSLSIPHNPKKTLSKFVHLLFSKYNWHTVHSITIQQFSLPIATGKQFSDLANSSVIWQTVHYITIKSHITNHNQSQSMSMTQSKHFDANHLR